MAGRQRNPRAHSIGRGDTAPREAARHPFLYSVPRGETRRRYLPSSGRAGARAGNVRGGQVVMNARFATVISALVTVALTPASAWPQRTSAPLDAPTAGRFAALALACVQQEYPNKISHILN